MAVSVRMDPLMEKELELAAKRKGITKSQFIIDAVERALGRRDPLALLNQVKEEFAPYRAEQIARNAALAVAEEPAAAGDKVRAKLRAQYAAQQEDFAAYLAAKSAGQEPPAP